MTAHRPGPYCAIHDAAHPPCDPGPVISSDAPIVLSPDDADRVAVRPGSPSGAPAAADKAAEAAIRAAPVRHYDETPWAIQGEQGAGYAWVMSAANSPNTLFHCATSRGAPHAKKLHGDDSSNLSFTDCQILFG